MEINLSVQNAETGQSKPSITPLQQYLLRPLALAFLCWYEYLQNYEIVKQPRGTKRKNASSTDGNLSDSSDDSTDDFSLRERYFLNPEHPDYSKLMVIPRKQPAVVQYHGFALKPSRRRTTEEHDEQYAMSALVMFFPFLPCGVQFHHFWFQKGSVSSSRNSEQPTSGALGSHYRQCDPN